MAGKPTGSAGNTQVDNTKNLIIEKIQKTHFNFVKSIIFIEVLS